MPESKRRHKVDQEKAQQTQISQEKAEQAKIHYRTWQRRRTFAWTLMGLGILVAASHFFEHLGVFNPYSQGLEDLTIGYPTAALIGLTGAIRYPRSLK